MIGDCWISATCDTGYELKVRKKRRTEDEEQRIDVFLLLPNSKTTYVLKDNFVLLYLSICICHFTLYFTTFQMNCISTPTSNNL